MTAVATFQEPEQRVDYEEQDKKVLAHNLAEMERKEYELHKEEIDYELKK